MEPLREPERLVAGEFRLVAELGRGGMGRVLLGVSPDGRLVAVKLVHEEFTRDGGFRARFRREVEASRRVSGAYTAAVVGADAGVPQPWLASVFVPGPTVSLVVERTGPLPTAPLVRLASGLAAALTEIHRAGLVHRDLKPSNVLLSADGPRVIDFGIARAADTGDGTEITRTGLVVGSPAFMSPEQAEGRRLTPASDVFSLGAVLVRAGTGHNPFAGDSALMTLYNVVHGEPDLTGMPEHLRELVELCLAKDPAARPSPEEIMAFMGPVPPSVRPWPDDVHGLIDAQHAEIARVLGLRGTGDVRIGDGEANVTGTLLMRPEPPPARRRLPDRRTLLLGGVGGASAILATALAVDKLTGPSSRKGSHPTPSPTSPSPEPSATASPEAGPERTAAYTLSAKFPSYLTAVRFSRNGRLLAVGDRRGAVLLCDATTLEVTSPLVDGEYGTTGDVMFSPDGRLLASVDEDATIMLWDVQGRTRTAELRGLKEQENAISSYSLAFSGDGGTLALASNQTITLWNVRTQARVATLRQPLDDPDPGWGDLDGVVLTDRGRTAITVTTSGNLRFWDVGRGTITATIRAYPDEASRDVAVTSDGKLLAVGGAGTVGLWEPAGRRKAGALDLGSDDDIISLAFSHDGALLAGGSLSGETGVWFTRTRKTIRTFDSESGGGETQLSKAIAGASPSSLDFSPDRGSLAVGYNHHIVLWKMP
jgi:serine/threonine protein kinase